MSVHKIEYSNGKDDSGFFKTSVLVTRDDIELPLRPGKKYPHLTHAELGRLLGLPCSNNDPWKSRKDTNTFFELSIVKRDSCSVFPTNDPSVIVTTFVCKSTEEAQRWFKDLKKKAARVVREYLKPAGLQLCFRMHTFLA